MKTILVPIGGTKDFDPLLDAVFGLARRFQSHVEGLHVRPDPAEALHATSMAFPGSMIESVLEAGARHAAEGADRARAIFAGYCAKHDIPLLDAPPMPDGISASWREETGKPSLVVSVRGRLADLIALSRPLEESPAPLVLEAALMETGRPVLVMPPKPPAGIGQRIAIGWNGSAVSAKAVAAAHEFLETAEAVTVLSTGEGNRNALTVKDLVDHLAWHGIAAQTKTFEAKSSRIGETLLKEARDLGADLFVLGGYGTSVTRELILGGVTRHMLITSEIPLFMVH